MYSISYLSIWNTTCTKFDVMIQNTCRVHGLSWSNKTNTFKTHSTTALTIVFQLYRVDRFQQDTPAGIWSHLILTRVEKLEFGTSLVCGVIISTQQLNGTWQTGHYEEHSVGYYNHMKSRLYLACFKRTARFRTNRNGRSIDQNDSQVTQNMEVNVYNFHSNSLIFLGAVLKQVI